MKQIYNTNALEIFHIEEEDQHMFIYKDDEGKRTLKITKFLFDKIEMLGIESTLVSVDLEKSQMILRNIPSDMNRVSVTRRIKANDDFAESFEKWCKPDQDLNYLMEITLEDLDELPVSKEHLINLEIIDEMGYDEIKHISEMVTTIIYDELKKKNVDVYDVTCSFMCTDEGPLLALEMYTGIKDGTVLYDEELYQILFE